MVMWMTIQTVRTGAQPTLLFPGASIVCRPWPPHYLPFSLPFLPQALCFCLCRAPLLNAFSSSPAGELLSQPRPEGVAEIICPKNGSERVNVALVYPPTPTVISPCSK